MKIKLNHFLLTATLIIGACKQDNLVPENQESKNQKEEFSNVETAIQDSSKLALAASDYLWMVPEYRNKVDGSAVTSLVSAETQLHSGNTGIDGFTFSLGHDQAIYSRNGQYFLKMQWDGNLVLYRNSGFKALWSSKTVQPNTGATFEFKIIRGNWMINKNQSGNITTIWQSNSGYVPRIEQGLAVPYFVLQNDGNIVMYISPYPPQGWEAVIAYRTNTAGGKTSGNYGKLQ